MLATPLRKRQMRLARTPTRRTEATGRTRSHALCSWPEVGRTSRIAGRKHVYSNMATAHNYMHARGLRPGRSHYGGNNCQARSHTSGAGQEARRTTEEGPWSRNEKHRGSGLSGRAAVARRPTAVRPYLTPKRSADCGAPGPQ